MDDPRCCGTGTCIINAEGFCWCGQRWDGQRMCFPDESSKAPGFDPSQDPPAQAGDQSDKVSK
jgi:hypothetical protein